MSEPLLEASGITKSFGGVRALRGADFAVHPGEVAALVGDNGAGKSTLVKILSGTLAPDGGEIRFEGRQVAVPNPVAARELGIETVYQDLALAPELDPAANLFLGRELVRPGLLGKLGFLDKAAMRRRTNKAFADLGIGLQDTGAMVANLSGGQRQSVAVSRAATWVSKVVFMDEPTAALGVVQSAHVRDLIRRVRDSGIAVVLISHNMPEVMELADRIEVLRLGVRVARYQAADTTMEQVIAAMTGALERRGGGVSDLTEVTAADEEPAEASEPSGVRAALRRRLTETTTWTFLILLGIVAGFAALRFQQFATVFNFRNIAADASGLLIIAVGMTFVIITAGIDLSVGSVLVFSGVIAAKVMLAIGGGGWGAIAAGLVAGLVAGTAWGVVNGVLITKARVPPLIVTLGTLGMALGSALLITGGIDVRGVPLQLTTTIGIGQLAGVPYVVIIAAAVTAVGAVTLSMTRFGRYTYAIGSNAEAARRAGINVDRHLIKVYALSGFLAGMAGMVSLARFATTTIGGHSTDNLAAIAAVVLGGTSLFGGIGTVLGTVVGVFIPAILQNGFVILGVQPFWQQVAVGAVLIIAVYIDQLKRRAQERGERR